MEQFLLLMMNDGTNTIKSHDDSTNVTINNNSGGHIYHTSQSAVIFVQKTLNNSGKIENKDGPNVNAITFRINWSNIKLKG